MTRRTSDARWSDGLRVPAADITQAAIEATHDFTPTITALDATITDPTIADEPARFTAYDDVVANLQSDHQREMATGWGLERPRDRRDLSLLQSEHLREIATVW
ncbi:MAG: hypothetical protein AB1Z66_14060 [Candidatus Limnocylindrales bacterium]